MPVLAQEQAAAFEYSPVVRLVRSGQFQAEVWRRDVRTDRSDLAWSNREIYPTTAAAMIEACTSLRKNFDAAFSCSDHQPVVLARHVGTDRNEVQDPPARATRQQFAAPPTSKVAASRAAPQGRVTDRAPGNPRVTAVPMKSAVPAVKRKVVVYEYLLLRLRKALGTRTSGIIRRGILGEAVKVAGVAAKAVGTEAWKTTRLSRKLISVERPSSCQLAWSSFAPLW